MLLTLQVSHFALSALLVTHHLMDWEELSVLLSKNNKSEKGHAQVMTHKTEYKSK